MKRFRTLTEMGEFFTSPFGVLPETLSVTQEEYDWYEDRLGASPSPRSLLFFRGARLVVDTALTNGEETN